MARTAADSVRRIGIRLAVLAQDGLAYAANDYDLDRYRQVAGAGGRPAVGAERPTR